MNAVASPINSGRLRRLLRRLLDIYSPSGKEEEIVDYLYGYLRRRGLPVIRQEVDDYRSNLIVAPAKVQPEAALIGHLDTVTAYDLEDFGSEKEGDLIIGLGAADMKGGCAAMIEAFTCLWENGFSDIPIMLALVVGEEEEGDGAETLVKDFHFPWAIIGEPTDLKPCLSHYGYLEVHLTTRGRRLHASLAKRGCNAVEDMLKILLKLTRYMSETRNELVYNIRDLFSVGGGFVVPEGCEAWLDVHLPPAAPVAEITMDLEEMILQERQADSSLDAAVRFTTIQPGYTLPEKGPVIEALREAVIDQGLEWTPLSFPSHSDANQLWSAGVKPIVIGCGQLEKAHGPEESVAFTQVRQAAELYYRLALNLIRARAD